MFVKTSDILKKSIIRSGDPPSLLALRARSHFEEVIREIFPQKKFTGDLKKIKARTLSWEALAVSVPSSVWAQELRLKEQRVLELLNKKLGAKEAVKRLKLRISVR